jgi:hypothetical protein
MKSRISLYVLLGLLLIALGGIWFFYGGENRTPLHVFSATINRDCAPWDGGAFTVSIPLRNGSSMAISIFRSPEIKLPASFSFPDESMRDGNALLLPPVGPPEQLTGKVWFQRVEQGIPIEGRFQFQTEIGTQFKGRFIAEWGNEIIYCG